MTEQSNSNETAKDPQSEGEISRREALRKLAKFSAYTAPTVVTLLASRPSLAQLTSAQCAAAQAMGQDDTAPGQGMQALDPGQPSANMDTVADCMST